jgi:hypothetical protein
VVFANRYSITMLVPQQIRARVTVTQARDIFRHFRRARAQKADPGSPRSVRVYRAEDDEASGRTRRRVADSFVNACVSVRPAYQANRPAPTPANTARRRVIERPVRPRPDLARDGNVPIGIECIGYGVAQSVSDGLSSVARGERSLMVGIWISNHKMSSALGTPGCRRIQDRAKEFANAALAWAQDSAWARQTQSCQGLPAEAHGQHPGVEHALLVGAT